MRQRCNRWLMHWDRHRAYLFLRELLPCCRKRNAVFSVISYISAASDEYDIETEVRLATGYGNTAAGHLLLAVTPEGTLTDYNGVTRSAIAGAAYSALNMETPLGGIAIYNISDDYYDADIIYKQTRGGIQFLNPASVH